MQPVLNIWIDLMTACCGLLWFFSFYGLYSAWRLCSLLCYPSALATESSLENTVLFLPACSAYSHSAYNSLSAQLKRAKQDFTVMLLSLSFAKTVCFLIQIGQKSLCWMAKSSGNISCVQKRQPGPVNRWALKRSQQENSSFLWSYRNVLFVTQPCFYELQQPKHKREM